MDPIGIHLLLNLEYVTLRPQEIHACMQVQSTRRRQESLGSEGSRG